MITTALQTFTQDQLVRGGVPGTGGLRQWILNNLVLNGGKSDNAGVMGRLGGVFVRVEYRWFRCVGGGHEPGYRVGQSSARAIARLLALHG